MNKASRQPWLILAFDCSLCAFCCFAEYEGDCDTGYLCCRHVFVVHLDEEMQPGTDCWAFRPKMDAETAADMVGCWLRGEATAEFCKERAREALADLEIE